MTPWLKVFETAKPGKVPVVKVVLRRAGEELLGVSAKVEGESLRETSHLV